MDNLITAFSKMVDASNSLTDKVLSTNIKSNSILDRLITLENQVESLKYANAEVISSPENLVQPDKDLVISISEPVSGTTEISAKDLNVKEFEATDGLVKFTATEDVTVKNLSTSGDLPKTTANAQVQVNASEYVKITQSSIDQTGYNAIEVGLKTVPKSVIIDGVSFNSTLTNNAISIFGTQDGGTITIQNCKFAKCSNPLRLSNNTGGKVTVNIIDCEFNDWDTNPTWAGMIICQDYTSKQADLAQENNLFSPDKMTINIINCTKNGKKITMTTPESVCGTNNADTQLLYVWNEYENSVPYSAERYPTLVIK